LHKQCCEGRNGRLEFRIIGFKRTHRWMDTQSTPIRDATGRITSVLSVTRDITGFKQAQDLLNQKNAWMRMAGKVARIGAWASYEFDPRIYWSAEACEVFGFPHDELPTLEEVLELL